MEWIRRLSTLGLLLFVAASLALAIVDTIGLQANPPVVNDPSTTATSQAPVIAYYFHTNTRCTTCRDIETNGQTALADAVHNGQVEWRVVNYEAPANKHFVAEYQLAFPSLVLVSRDDRSPPRWKSLDRVWNLSDDSPAFIQYVHDELAKFSGSQP